VHEPIIVDASKYGAPTRRKRVIVVGYLPEKIHHFEKSDLLPSVSISNNVRDAISDLLEPINQSKDKKDFGWGGYNKLRKISNYAKAMRKIPPEGLGDKFFIDNLKKGLVSGNFETLHTTAVKNRLESLKPGEIDKVSKAKKLQWDGFCPTLRAGTGADKGSHQAIRPIHPAQERVITVREAARLQGFPDWFAFHPTKWHSFRMIGNSVSPLVSQFILNFLKSKMR